MYYLAAILYAITVPVYSAKTKLCAKELTIDISNGTHLRNGIYHNGIHYTKNEYFVDNETQLERGCICMKTPCIRKCCPTGQGMSLYTKSCEKMPEIFDPVVWDEFVPLEGLKASEVFHSIYSTVDCSKADAPFRVRVTKVTDIFRIQANGRLYIDTPEVIPPWTERTPDKYCMDTFVFEDENGMKRTQLDALVCFAAESGDGHNYYVSATGMIISCFFILITLAVYAWLPELRNLHGCVLTSYLSCLFVAFFFLALMQISIIVNNINPRQCLVYTFIIYFALLVAFFWLNIMSFDIWWTFSGKHGLYLEKLTNRGRYVVYACYAFGIPSLLTVLLAALEFSNLPPHWLLPGIKHYGCFIQGPRKFLYLYVPMLILFVANITFFIRTAFMLNKISKQTSVLKSKESGRHGQRNHDRQRFLLYLKIFSVMGVNWVLEVISALYPEGDYIWIVTDTYNVLIGLIMFIIFVCKKKILRLIKKRYTHLRGGTISRTYTSSRTGSSRDETVSSSFNNQL